MWIEFVILNSIMEGLPTKENREQDLIKKLESFYFLPTGSIVDIICVYKKIKPATIVDIFHDPDYPEEYFHQDVASVAETLKSLGLPYSIETVSVDEEFEEAHIIIAQNKEKLEKVKAASVNAEKGWDRSIGEALGYPQTAIEAFINGTTTKPSELPEEVRDSDHIKFLGFLLSRDHWQEELEEVRKRADMVRQTAPDLYNKIVKK